jgi:hypothetical protein
MGMLRNVLGKNVGNVPGLQKARSCAKVARSVAQMRKHG